MKFGKNIRKEAGACQRLHFIDYKLLKRRIKSAAALLRSHDYAGCVELLRLFFVDLEGELSLIRGEYAHELQQLQQQQLLLQQGFEAQQRQVGVQQPSGRVGGSAEACWKAEATAQEAAQECEGGTVRSPVEGSWKAALQQLSEEIRSRLLDVNSLEDALAVLESDGLFAAEASLDSEMPSKRRQRSFQLLKQKFQLQEQQRQRCLR
ncbi:zinc finger (c3hc4 type ring finger) domain-containing protein [Cyclospora cayetanensis]|uniref:Zinc finger (C3hc4 type ring finger) domain-containing protein n=1 Tax=Cyclospora cayetanensis TaxID=88456 RepID=A0A1D3D8M6_9EIME|nr:zinc finger (c3hc4 type ring finger) domain-containing protein [Cyclospora cayetanensis]